jgi:hypothetical protein
LLPSPSFSKLTTRRRARAATRGSADVVCLCPAGRGRPCLVVARRRTCAAIVLVRPRASLRGRTASRRRPRVAWRHSGPRARSGCRVVRRHGPDRRQDRVHPDADRIHADARPPRLDRRPARCAGRRRLPRRHGRPERPGRPRRAVRVLRRASHQRRAGIRRSAIAAAGSPGSAPGDAARSCVTARGCTAGRRTSVDAGQAGVTAGAGGSPSRAGRRRPARRRRGGSARPYERARSPRLDRPRRFARLLGSGESAIARRVRPAGVHGRRFEQQAHGLERSAACGNRPREGSPAAPGRRGIARRSNRCGWPAAAPRESGAAKTINLGRGAAPSGLVAPRRVRCARRPAAPRSARPPAGETARHAPYHGLR